MRMLQLASLAALALGAGCGQKGPLVLPPKSVATQVVIRPAAAPPAAAPADGAVGVPTPPPAAPPHPQGDDDQTPPKR